MLLVGPPNKEYYGGTGSIDLHSQQTGAKGIKSQYNNPYSGSDDINVQRDSVYQTADINVQNTQTNSLNYQNRPYLVSNKDMSQTNFQNNPYPHDNVVNLQNSLHPEINTVYLQNDPYIQTNGAMLQSNPYPQTNGDILQRDPYPLTNGVILQSNPYPQTNGVNLFNNPQPQIVGVPIQSNPYPQTNGITLQNNPNPQTDGVIYQNNPRPQLNGVNLQNNAYPLSHLGNNGMSPYPQTQPMFPFTTPFAGGGGFGGKMMPSGPGSSMRPGGFGGQGQMPPMLGRPGGGPASFTASGGPKKDEERSNTFNIMVGVNLMTSSGDPTEGLPAGQSQVVSQSGKLGAQNTGSSNRPKQDVSQHAVAGGGHGYNVQASSNLNLGYF